MAESKRLFVGGLYPSVTEDELRQRFSKFGKIENVEIKSKAIPVQGDSSNIFAYIDIKISSIDLVKCFSVFSNCRWKGYPIKLEVAKESFLNRLRKEREGNFNGAKSNNPNFVPIIPNAKIKVEVKTKELPMERNNEVTVNKSPVTKYKQPISDNRSGKLQAEEETLIGRDVQFSEEGGSGCKKKIGKNGEEHALKKFRKIDEDDSPFHKSQKVNKLRETFQVSQTDNSRSHVKQTSNVVERLEKFSGSVWKDDDSETVNQNLRRSFVTNANKGDKSSLSNAKRLKSIADKVEETKAKEKLISNALKKGVDFPKRSNKIVFDSDDEGEYVAQPEKPTVVKLKDKQPALFNDSEDESEDDSPDRFNYKPQFDGQSGQKLLELQTRFGNDDRFRLDERFKEDENEEKDDDEDAFQQEKNRNLEILGDIIGGPVKRDKTRSEKKNVLVRRYDPTKESCADLEVQRPKISSPEKPVEMEKEDAAEPLEEEKVEVSDKRFYEVRTNLSNLFSKDKKSAEDFSLLKNFGCAEPKMTEKPGKQPKTVKDGTTRTAWGRNPFHYDSSSSDDEEPVEKKNQEPISVVQEDAKTDQMNFFPLNPKFKVDGLSFYNKGQGFSHDNWLKKKNEIVETLKVRRKRSLRKERVHIKLFKRKQSHMQKKGRKNFKRKSR